MFIISCSKNNNVAVPKENEQKLFDVSFNVSGFVSNVTPLSSLKSSALSSTTAAGTGQTVTQTAPLLYEQVSTLHYLVYNSSGQLLKDSVQRTPLSTFGTFNLQLPAGSYKMLVAGLNGTYSLISKESSTTAFISPVPSNGVYDWFKQVADFKVTDQPVNQNVVLDRVVGKVGILLTDALPSNLAKITIAFTSGSWFYLNYSFNPGTNTQTRDFVIKSSLAGTKNFSADAFVIPLNDGKITTDVSIRAYSVSGDLIVEKIIKNVVIEKNKLTTLSGELFSDLPAGGAATGTSVSINSEWKPATTVAF